jgi:hypothetical protein
MSETSVNKYQHTLRNSQEGRWRPFEVISTEDIEAQLYPEISINTVHSESRWELTKCVGSDVHEILYRPELELKWIKQLHTLPVLHFNRCLTIEYSETTAHCNGNYVTDKQSTYRSLSAQRLSERTVLTKFYCVWTYKPTAFIYVCCPNLFVELNMFIYW